jgi:hypothetical protein
MKSFYNELNNISTLGEVNYIRPKFILKYLEELFVEPIEINLFAPSADIGSLTTLEATMIVSILKIFEPSRVFEFGTFLGYSSSVFLKNLEKCIVYTLDLDEKIEFNNNDLNQVLINDSLNDQYLSFKQSVIGPKYLQSFLKLNDERIVVLKSNSLTFDVEPFNDKIEFVFVDGGHLFDIVKNDTEKSFKMLKKGGVIIWHDYNSKIHSDVTIYLNKLSETKKIFHIENTLLAFHIIE